MTSLVKRVLKYWIPVLFWMGVIFFFSSNSDPYLLLPAALRQLTSSPVMDGTSLSDYLNPLMHFGSYGVLAFLVMRAVSVDHGVKRKHVLLSIFFSMFYAVSDETHQLFVPGRSFQLFDLLVDLFGVLVGVWVFWRYKNSTA